MTIRTGWLYALLVAAVLAGSVSLRIADPIFLQALRSLAYDTYQQLAPTTYNDDTPVRIVAVDEESLQRIGPWPWPRDILAKLLTTLAGQGAVVVAFDMLLPENGEDDDAAFAKAIAASPVVLPVVPTDLPADDPTPPPKAEFAISGANPLPFIPAFANVATNSPAFDAAAAGLGAIVRSAENNGRVRRLPLVSRVGANIFPALALEVLRVAQRAGTYTLSATDGDRLEPLGRPPGLVRVEVGDISMPTDPDGGMRLDLRMSNPQAHIPAWRVLEGGDDAARIAGRIVVVGITAEGLGDFRATPLEPSIARVELQAEAIEHILSGRTVTRPGEALAVEIAVVVLLGLLLGWLLPRLGLVAGVAASIVGVAAIVAAGWFAYRDLGLVFDPTWPALSIWVLAALAALYLHHRLEMRRGEIRTAFGGSLSPAAVEAVLHHPERLVLDGETRELTVMFCEIRNFSAIAEQLEAQDLVGFINRLYAPLSQAILASHGTIARNMGDSILAFWNAPLDDEAHAANACHAAVTMLGEMRRFDAENRRDAVSAGRRSGWVALGIGIATGNCCVGNLGGGERFDYSAIGGDVGLAAYFQGLSDIYGVGVVVGEATVERMSDPRVLELDLVRVKGRKRPARLFTLADAVEAEAATFDRLAPVHAEMVTCYRGGDWDGAEAALEQCRSFGVEGLVTLYTLYRTRIATSREIAPPENWDGADAASLR